MSNKIEKYSVSELDTIRNFFTDEQWDVIDYALSEYQDHDDYTDVCNDTLNRLGDLFRTNLTTNHGQSFSISITSRRDYGTNGRCSGTLLQRKYSFRRKSLVNGVCISRL